MSYSKNVIPLRFLLITLNLILVISTGINAQTENQEKRPNACIQIKNANISISKDEILLMGDVLVQTSINLRKDSPLSLAQAIAMAGGFPKNANTKKIKVIKCDSEFEKIESQVLVNFKKFQEGKIKDLILKGQEIIIVGDVKIKRAIKDWKNKIGKPAEYKGPQPKILY